MKYSLRIVILVLPFLLMVKLSRAQFSDSVFFEPNQIHQSGSLHLGFNGLGYFINQEYFNPMVNSYTMAGYHVAPVLKYQLSEKIRISAGGFLLNSLGRNELLEVSPVFQFSYAPFGNFTLQFGTISGGLSHGLPEQVYSYSQALTQSNEEGIRALYRNDRLFFDVWLDWRYLTFPKDTETERIFGGYHINWNHAIGTNFKMHYYTQMVAYHNGGQDLAIYHKVQTYLNLVNGFQFTAKLNHELSVSNKSFYVQFYNTIPRQNFPYNMGFGFASEMQAKWKFLEGKFGYWYGNRFYNPLGEFQFSSVSQKSNFVLEPYRHVFYSHVKIEEEVYPGFYVGLRTGAYLSKNLNSQDFYIGILMRFNHDFLINK